MTVQANSLANSLLINNFRNNMAFLYKIREFLGSKVDHYRKFIFVGCGLAAIWLTYNMLFAYLFVLGMSYILQAISETSCLEPLVSELVQNNARLDLGFITLNPTGEICMMKMESQEVPGHPCKDLNIITQRTQPSGSVQTCFHFNAWLECVSKSNGWGALKSNLTEWTAKQANLHGQMYCVDIPGTQSKDPGGAK
ncbi:hypothetical protein BSKO_mt0072 (mitochondrion) [Bryopsis sp. KO-2023]|nr:hypothetical protein BSKO_mt0072 [Bryopsis sp. KO-2023]